MNRRIRQIAKFLKRLMPQWLFDLVDPLGHGLEAFTAAAVNGFPGYRMRVIGITGTNGKTSTSVLTANIFANAGYKVGLSTTALYWIGDRHFANDRNTTVTNPWDLQRMLKEMKRAGTQVVILEVTSHSLAQNRVAGVRFEAAGLTNITHEHLDYHRTMERYRAAKAKLFKKPGLKVSVLNADDPVYDQWHRFKAPTHLSYSLKVPATLTVEKLNLSGTDSNFVIRYKDQSYPTKLSIPGRFNVANALAAAGIALGMGLSMEDVVAGLASTTLVPGRMETIDAGQDFTVIVDYGLTPDAIKNLYQTLRQFTKGRLIVILGAAGERDRAKRPLMGKIAIELCDYVVLTDEEPYSEDPQSIIDMIEPGVIEGGGKLGENYEVILDRRQAIARVFSLAKAGDTVALTGMGHQSHRTTNAGTEPWDEREIARELLKK